MSLCGRAHSPVDGWRASLGFTAEHHLPALLPGLHGIHDAAGLLAEDGALHDTALCGTRGQTTVPMNTFVKSQIVGGRNRSSLR